MRKNKGWAVLVILGKTQPFKRLLFLGTIALIKQPKRVWCGLQGASASRPGAGMNMLMWVWSLGTSLRDVCAACHTRVGFRSTGVFGELQQEHAWEVSRPACDSKPREDRDALEMFRPHPAGGSLSDLSFCARDLLPVFRLVGVTVSQSHQSPIVFLSHFLFHSFLSRVCLVVVFSCMRINTGQIYIYIFNRFFYKWN